MMRDKLLGRTTSYRLNGYDDALMADRIVAYVRSRQEPTGTDDVDERVRRYLEETAPDDYEQRLLVKAFTLKWLNGFADLMWARALENAFNLEPLCTGRDYGHDPYAAYETGDILLTSWTFLLGDDHTPILDFTAPIMDLTLDRATIAREIIAVQHGNTAANQHNRELIEAGEWVDDHHKVNTILQLAEGVENREAFLTAAARTQTAAGMWDTMFTTLLRVRFRAW